MLLLGYDIGSSSVKASLLDGATGKALASAYYPKMEMNIVAKQSGWAEQHPETWWEALRMATQELFNKAGKIDKQAIKAIGIAYQMHGLVLIDKDQQVIRPSIIWCDSRAVNIGRQAFEELGRENCLSHLLNSPGNFTASKLKWVRENEPFVYKKIHKIMLPGDYIAMKLSGEVQTTISGLSEAILWDFKEQKVAEQVLDYFEFKPSIIPDIVPTFSEQGQLKESSAKELDLPAGIPICYRAGDQPNNAFSLNVLKAGEIAATAGTSGVVYGVGNETRYDPESRVNTFAHVNHSLEHNSLGTLLCINGSGILYSWAKRNLGSIDYEKMNALAAQAPIGASGIRVLPFGNGAERILQDRNIGSHFSNINFNTHSNAHLFRGMLEGIVYSLKYGLEIMQGVGVQPQVIRAGHANLFLSEIFREALASIAKVSIELYNTDGAQGAARGAGVGAGYYTLDNAFVGLEKIGEVEPNKFLKAQYRYAYNKWKQLLDWKIQAMANEEEEGE
ncbi:MAG: FGGY family carbohydrate kinase [Bacteroidota bacterium]